MFPKRVEYFFLSKQLQYNIHKTYGVSQGNRFQIVSQLVPLLDDKFPKVIVRADVKSFYESIPTSRLLSKINDDNLLSPSTRRFIRQVLKTYSNHVGSDIGIPRGIGVSAYLAELYLRVVDRELKRHPQLVYYQRYVDDIIAIYLPDINSVTPTKFLDLVEEVFNKHELQLNKASDKYDEIDLSESIEKDWKLTYLGYRFSAKNMPKREKTTPLVVQFSNQKVNKYKRRIDLMVAAFENEATINHSAAYSRLKKRLLYMTGNTRLSGNKSHIVVGIYFSNSHLNRMEDLDGLDSYLSGKIDSSSMSLKQKTKLLKYSFSSGFKEKRFLVFPPSELRDIIRIWK